MLISVEGIHGAGKSLVVEALRAFLVRRGLATVLGRDQAATDLGRQLRSLHLETSVAVDPVTESCLVAAARRESFVRIVRPALDRGVIVIAERYVDAFFAFGYARGVADDLLNSLAMHSTEGRAPQLTLLLDLDPSTALARIDCETRHRVEREPLEFHERLREGYLRCASAQPHRVVLIDASQPPEKVAERAIAIVSERLLRLPAV